MISGEGFFGLLAPGGGTAYTRDGSFHLDSEGTLVSRRGFPVAPGLSFPPDTATVRVDRSGNVRARAANQTEPAELGRIPVHTFANPAGLSAQGGNMFRETPASGPPWPGRRGRARPGEDPPGDPRGVQRQRHDRDDRPDQGPEGARDERQDHEGRGRDAADHQQREVGT